MDNMNVEEKLRNIKPSDKPLLWIGYTLLGMMLLLGQPANAQSATDNVIDISNPGSSDNLNLNIQQAGYDNEVTLSIGGSSNTLDIYQLGAKNTTKYTDTWGSGYNWGGDLYGQNNNITVKQYTDTSKSISDNYFGFHIQGNNNTVKVGQEWMITDQGVYGTNPANGWGDHYLRLDIHGDYNDIIHTQRTDAASDGQTSYLNVYADYNDVYIQQRQGQHTMNMTINNDYNEVWFTQAGQPAHTATVTLGGNYPTTLTVQQGVHASTSSFTYSLTQDCQTVGGCTVSVTQQ
jgi:hypothetical protein